MTESENKSLTKNQKNLEAKLKKFEAMSPRPMRAIARIKRYIEGAKQALSLSTEPKPKK